MADFFIKQNDTSPGLEVTLLPTTDVTGATIVFSMKNAAGTVVVNRQAVTIVTALTGIIRYPWIGADTATAGEFEGEFEVTFADSSIETFPNTSNLMITITDDIA